MKPSICVLGGGVVGLTCAATLAEHFSVRVLGEHIGPESASIVATAIWHIYLVDTKDQHTIDWASQTLEKLLEIERKYPDAGVCRVRGIEVFRKSEPELPSWSHIPRIFEQLTDEEIQSLRARDPATNAAAPIKWGYRIEVPAARMDVYLDWLMIQIERKGGVFLRHKVSSLEEAFNFGDIVINCTGYGARDLVTNSNLLAVRGQYIVFLADNEAPTEYFGDDHHPVETSYLIPRTGEVLIGGTEEYGVEELRFTRTNEELIGRVSPFVGWASSALNKQPLRQVVGIRPYREGGVLLEIKRAETEHPIIHNFGHGGSGFSLSWGCADRVLYLVQQYIAGRSA